MPEEKGTLFTTVLILIALSFLGALFGGIALLVRPPTSKTGSPAYSASRSSQTHPASFRQYYSGEFCWDHSPCFG